MGIAIRVCVYPVTHTQTVMRPVESKGGKVMLCQIFYSEDSLWGAAKSKGGITGKLYIPLIVLCWSFRPPLITTLIRPNYSTWWNTKKAGTPPVYDSKRTITIGSMLNCTLVYDISKHILFLSKFSLIHSTISHGIYRLNWTFKVPHWGTMMMMMMKKTTRMTNPNLPEGHRYQASLHELETLARCPLKDPVKKSHQKTDS